MRGGDAARAWLRACPKPEWAEEWRAVQSLAAVIASAEDRGWADCIKGVEMTRDTFREGTASRAACEVVLEDLRKLAALPRGS